MKLMSVIFGKKNAIIILNSIYDPHFLCVYTEKNLELIDTEKNVLLFESYNSSPEAEKCLLSFPPKGLSTILGRAVCSPFTSPVCSLKMQSSELKADSQRSLAKAENNGMTISFVPNTVTFMRPEMPTTLNSWLKA